METRYVYEGLLLAVRLRCDAFSASRHENFRYAFGSARETLGVALGSACPSLCEREAAHCETEAMFMIGLGRDNGWLKRVGHGIFFILSRDEANQRLRELAEGEVFKEAAERFMKYVHQLPQAA
jgi:hypothetical protein